MSIPRWFLDELEHAGSEHLNAEYVAGYDRKAGTDPAEDLALLLDLGLGEQHTLVDLGTGTGALPLIAASHCRRVVAVDVSAPMLDVLRERAAVAGIGNIVCVQAGFLSYQHEGEPADFVYSRHALHHLPDFWKVIALQRVASMLKPGGIFHFRDMRFSADPGEVEGVIERWLSGAAETPDVGWTREELETHLREEYSTFTWLIEPMLERVGFEIRERHGLDSKIYVAYTCVKR
ncbi:MAG TPA: class I SAM-dependent methyltransferase [Thermomicrobiales bacterium]|nr:class I SAM-dependent methyltransferase [Thermomicrobiales bacterium]